jgi:hypothetical protein
MASRVLHNQEEAGRFARFLCNYADFPLTVAWQKGEARTSAQNRLIHRWYGEISVQQGQDTPAEVKAHCNLVYGRPILERDDPEWSACFGYIFDSLNHAAKLKAVRVLDVPFTRRMKVEQLREYMDQMARDYRDAGVVLTDPDALRYEGAA